MRADPNLVPGKVHLVWIGLVIIYWDKMVQQTNSNASRAALAIALFFAVRAAFLAIT